MESDSQEANQPKKKKKKKWIGGHKSINALRQIKTAENLYQVLCCVPGNQDNDSYTFYIGNLKTSLTIKGASPIIVITLYI